MDLNILCTCNISCAEYGIQPGLPWQSGCYDWQLRYEPRSHVTLGYVMNTHLMTCTWITQPYIYILCRTREQPLAYMDVINVFGLPAHLRLLQDLGLRGLLYQGPGTVSKLNVKKVGTIMLSAHFPIFIQSHEGSGLSVIPLWINKACMHFAL